MISAFFALLSIASVSTLKGTFTQDDRNIFWQVDIPDGLDTSVAQPAFMEFHGDLVADESGVLEAVSPLTRRFAAPHKALAITFAAQDVATSENCRRFNGSLDSPLLVAAVRSNLGGAIKIDTNRVVLHGRSSGGGFLDYLLQKQLFGWGGGMFIQCGLHNVMSDPIPSNRDWARKFRVFVATTPDDFLYSHYYPILEHARDWAGYDVRWSKAGAGGHCTTAEETRDSAVAWLFRALTIDAEPTPKSSPGRWLGISSLSGIKGVAATPSGTLWFVNSVGGKSYAYRSTDYGATWTSPWSATDSASKSVGGIANFGETVVISHLRKLVVIGASTSIKTLDKTYPLSPALTSDASRIWLKGTAWMWSKDTGTTWTAVPSDWSIPDQFATGAWKGSTTKPPHFVRLHDSTMVILEPNAALQSADSIAPPEGRILTSTRKGDTLLASVWDGTKQSIQVMVNRKWSALPWPSDDGNTSDSKVTAVHQLALGLDSRPYVMGKPSFVGSFEGTWQHMPAAYSASVEPTAFLSDGRILRTANKGFGVMLWTPPTLLRTSSIESTKPAERFLVPLDQNPDVRRIGGYLELSSQGGPWNVRWMDGSGRVVAEQSHPSAAMIPLRPSAKASRTYFVQVFGRNTNVVLSTFP